MSERERGPLEQEIEEIMRFELSAIPAVQNAYKAGRSMPTKQDLVSTTPADASLEALEITGAAVNGLREAVRRLAREIDNRDSA